MATGLHAYHHPVQGNARWVRSVSRRVRISYSSLGNIEIRIPAFRMTLPYFTTHESLGVNIAHHGHPYEESCLFGSERVEVSRVSQGGSDLLQKRP